ncbi:MAG: hypothetical protein JWP78_1582 [Mucilaginibacter sp.]|nr:hypothetical protein [Mucilaginibacter sp.]
MEESNQEKAGISRVFPLLLRAAGDNGFETSSFF